MSSTNQHYTPKFLLRGFASSRNRDEVYTWLFRRGAGPINTNITNVGAEFDFYRGPSNRNADSVIRPLEKQFAKCVARLRHATKEIQVSDTIVPDLVVHVMLRNKHLRQAMCDLVLKFTEAMRTRMNSGEVLTRCLITAISQKPHEFLAHFKEGALRANIDPQWALNMLDNVIRNPELLSAQSTSGELERYFNDLTKFLSGSFPDFVRSSHVEGLLSDTLPRQWVEAIEDWSWFLVIREKGTFIFGDVGPLFKVKGSRQYKSLPSRLYDFDFGYLPISDTHLLVGFVERADRLDAEELNIATSTCSSQFFISSMNTDREMRYLPTLGSKVDLISDEEFAPIIDRVLFPGKTS
jgi:hypothetical protein